MSNNHVYIPGTYNDPEYFSARCSDKDDRELRRWCVEQCEPLLHFERKIEAAEALYNWVRNQPKADAA